MSPSCILFCFFSLHPKVEIPFIEFLAIRNKKYVVIVTIAIFYCFYLFTVQSLPPSGSPLPQFLIPFLLPPVSKRMSPLLPHQARPLHSLGPPVSQGLGASSPTEARPGSPLLYMCQELAVYQLVYAAWSVDYETASLPMVLPSFSTSSSLSLIQEQGSPTSVHWLGISICI